MASRPPQLCRQCRRTCDGHYCELHANARPEYERQRRASDPLRKLYKTARWTAVRSIVLARDPVCQDGRVCERRSLSAVVDHTIPAREYIAQSGGDTNAFFDEDNLRGLCKHCHDSKTATEDSRFAGSHE